MNGLRVDGRGIAGAWAALLLCLASCGGGEAAVTAATFAPLATRTSAPVPVIAMSTPAPSATAAAALSTLAPLPRRETAVPTFTPTTAPTSSWVPTITPSPTTDLYADFTIERLANREYGGGLVQIEETLAREETFTRYLFTYPSDGLQIYGYVNVPHEGVKFPVVIMLHGYIDPEEYEIVAYTRRYADALAEAGYFVFHPNLRNYPPSENGPDPFRIGFAVDVLNLIAIIREQSQDITGTLRRANRDEIYLWGHSMGGGVALRVITVNNEPYLKAAVLYGSMSGDERLNYLRIQDWSEGQRGSFELDASAASLRAISPIYHLDRIRTAISIHHSSTDEVVPAAWSDDLCHRMLALEMQVECFSYTGQPHTFHGYGDQLFMERVLSFFERN